MRWVSAGQGAQHACREMNGAREACLRSPGRATWLVYAYGEIEPWQRWPSRRAMAQVGAASDNSHLNAAATPIFTTSLTM